MGSDIWLEMYANSAIKIMTERKKKKKKNIYIYIYVYIYIYIYIYICNNGVKDTNFNLDKRLWKAKVT